MIKDRKVIIVQFIKFGLVGLSNTAISLGVYYIFIWLNFHYIIANTMGFIISVFNSYYWNNKCVFKKTQIGNLKPLMKTFMAYGVTFLLNNLMLFILIDKLDISDLISPIVCLLLTIPLNFLINKYWAFK